PAVAVLGAAEAVRARPHARPRRDGGSDQLTRSSHASRIRPLGGRGQSDHRPIRAGYAKASPTRSRRTTSITRTLGAGAANGAPGPARTGAGGPRRVRVRVLVHPH